MLAASSGRGGNFEELGLAADEQQVAVIAAADRTPLEVVLPDGSSGEWLSGRGFAEEWLGGGVASTAS